MSHDKAFFERFYRGQESLSDEFLKANFRTFKVGRLFFRYIKGTELEAQGWTSERLAKVFAEAGVIRMVTLQQQDDAGRFTKGVQYYVEMPGRMPKRTELIRFVTDRSKK